MRVLEERMTALEGGADSVALATGAAAITYALIALASPGDTIVAAKNINGTTYNLLSHGLSRYGIKTRFVDIYDEASLNAALDDTVRGMFIETVSNPHGEPSDIEKCAKAAHRSGVPLIVDNTFATPYLVRPIEWGADIVIHSATKFLGGHGSTMGGVLTEVGCFSWELGGKYPQLSGKTLTEYVRGTLLHDTGATLAPMSAFLILQGLETLSLRVERHTENALAAVKALSVNPAVEHISHPSLIDSPYNAIYRKYFPKGGISVFTIDVRGGRAQAWDFIEHLKLFSLLANVADVKSLAIHPATTTHCDLTAEELSAQRIGDNTVRLSIGIEHIDDIVYDLEQALAHTKQ